MTSLEDLPVETFCVILRFVGSSELRKQKGCCLTVCKWWYELVRDIVFGDFLVTTGTLTSLPLSEGSNRATFIPYVKRITVELRGLAGLGLGSGSK